MAEDTLANRPQWEALGRRRKLEDLGSKSTALGCARQGASLRWSLATRGSRPVLLAGLAGDRNGIGAVVHAALAFDLDRHTQHNTTGKSALVAGDIVLCWLAGADWAGWVAVAGGRIVCPFASPYHIAT